jgi:RNA polymerase sigma-70 factor (ECF subfamily)
LPSQELGPAAIADIDAVFMSMFDEQRDRLYTLALRLTGRPLDAEDLTAETFLRAYRSLCSFDYERLDTLHPRAWLSAILVNEWRNQRRTASRRPATVSAAAVGAPEPADPGAGVEERAEGGDDRRALASMLLELPERQRVAVLLRYIVDLPIAQIAEAMGCPSGTVKSHIRRGLDRLRPDGGPAVARDPVPEGGPR